MVCAHDHWIDPNQALSQRRVVPREPISLRASLTTELPLLGFSFEQERRTLDLRVRTWEPGVVHHALASIPDAPHLSHIWLPHDVVGSHC
jgi:hypothetical protein